VNTNFGLTRPGTESWFTDYEANALTTRPRTSIITIHNIYRKTKFNDTEMPRLFTNRKRRVLVIISFEVVRKITNVFLTIRDDRWWDRPPHSR